MYALTEQSDRAALATPRSMLYDGTRYRIDDFVRYVEEYDFGTIPPSFIVLHHTYRPGASWASSGAQYDWDGGEQ